MDDAGPEPTWKRGVGHDGKVIQGSFLSGQPKLPSPVSARLPPPIQAKTATRPPPAPPFAVRPPAPAFAGRRPGPPVPAFAGRAPVAQPRGAGDAFSVDPGQLGLASGGGRPLPEAVRGKMEAALGADFSGVRVHVGPQAERIGAIAFTIGSDIHFAPGRYQPDTVHGQQLLGHELTHVVQQRQGRVRVPASAELAIVQDRVLEAEADRLGWAAARHVPARPLNPTVQRSAIGPALPRQMPPAQAARPATVQRKITHDGTNYVGDEDRPKWRALLKKYVIDEYNLRTGGSLAYNVDLTDEDLDRCHRVSFSDIEALILGFLNGSVSSTDFILLTALPSTWRWAMRGLIGAYRKSWTCTSPTRGPPTA
jgi:hypothetical protein